MSETEKTIIEELDLKDRPGVILPPSMAESGIIKVKNLRDANVDIRDRDELLLDAIATGNLEELGDPRDRTEKFIYAISEQLHKQLPPLVVRYSTTSAINVTNPPGSPVAFVTPDIVIPQEYKDAGLTGNITSIYMNYNALTFIGFTVYPLGHSSYPDGGVYAWPRSLTGTFTIPAGTNVFTVVYK